MTYTAQSGRHGGTIFGFPLRGFGLFTSLLLSVAAAFFTFFATTCIAIFGLLLWNTVGGHTVDFAISYRYIGLPAGIIVLLIALPVFGTLWARDKLRR
jgi:hypothetical protein